MMKRFRLALIAVLLLGAHGCSLLPGRQMARRRDAMLEAGHKGLCRVHYYFARPEDEVADMSGRMPWETPDESLYQHYIDQQMSLLTVGLLMDAEGHVLVGDLHLDDRWIDRVEVLAPDGTVCPAEREKLLGRFEGGLLKLKRAPEGWRPPRFIEKAGLGPDEPAYVVSLWQLGKKWWVDVSAAGQDDAYAAGDEQPPRLGVSGGASSPINMASMFFQMSGGGWRASGAQPGLLCDCEGRPIGAVTASGLFDPTQQMEDWQHERLLDGPGLTFEQLVALKETCREEFGRNVYECKILYRQETDDTMGTDMPYIPRSLMGYLGEAGDGKEWETFALGVGPNVLMVPLSIDKEQAARIEEIQLTVDEEVRQCEFMGAYREIGAFLVELKDGTLPSAARVVSRPQPEPLRLFLTASPRKKMGAKHLKVRPNRWVFEQRGYRDLYYVSPSESVPQGSWLLDTDLNVVGVYARQRIEGEEIKDFGPDEFAFFAGGPFDEGSARVFWSGELETMLQDPVAHFDPQIRHKTKEEAKRIVWLGVEFSAVNPELAKQLDIEKETKDGNIGLLVSRLYAGSPAEEMGIQEGDVLLRVHTRKRPDPIELSGSREGMFWDSFDWTHYMDYEYMEEYGGTSPHWPVRLNYLTMLLQRIGEGEEVQLDYLHAGQQLSKDYDIQLAPRDFASARKYKNKQIGLTVKDLTYEVRTSLRLEEDRQAVVVAKVEPGSPAEVANIRPFELITTMDGEPVGSAEAFEAAIEEAVGEGKEAVRLNVEYLGKSRLADLALTQAAESE
jgi:hypothetical protein